MGAVDEAGSEALVAIDHKEALLQLQGSEGMLR